MSIDTTELAFSTDGKEIQERLHALEVAQATGAATLAGAQATQAAAQAGTTDVIRLALQHRFTHAAHSHQG